ncbi:uncharacterized protein LOC127265088 [Andrographis paniculata]|uniref:uncharacterized protein LOC127265088 n=1 Tax=Andrographis paniculata TaxID=175694 RepID=UPI0021E87654|nr:uncharacterized protein LOC127265088 [Andrographis paniculata]
MENSAATAREEKEGSSEGGLSAQSMKEGKTMSRRKKKSFRYFLPKFGCMKLDDDVSRDDGGSFDVEANSGEKNQPPTHLVVMVNGIIGSAEDWKYAAYQLARAYPNDVIVHCSESNASKLTFDGIDVMGTRLANEVISVVSRHPALQKISFVGHSLGGLVARYAVAKLYQQDSIREKSGEGKEEDSGNEPRICLEEKTRASICGLEPMNFITVATPHLGSRGHRQVPMFCGIYNMEIFAMRTSWLFGPTGKHLFLCDNEDGESPLLLRMTKDSEELMFISALKLFKRRVAYANVHFDHIVGWSSSSLRRRNELPKRRSLLRNAKYPHIVYEQQSNTGNAQELPLGVKVMRRRRTHDMEETMIRGLTGLSWERVDVNFGGSSQRFLAHNTIQVQHYCINSHGADVIQHMIDNFAL